MGRRSPGAVVQSQIHRICKYSQKKEWDGWESSIETNTLTYVKKTANGNLLYDAGNPKLVLCEDLEGWDGEGGGSTV